jgi:hypothetical protein
MQTDGELEGNSPPSNIETANTPYLETHLLKRQNPRLNFFRRG